MTDLLVDKLAVALYRVFAEGWNYGRLLYVPFYRSIYASGCTITMRFSSN